MNFSTALAFLKTGHTVWRRSVVGKYLVLNREEQRIYAKGGNYPIPWEPTQEDILADDWDTQVSGMAFTGD